MDSERRNSGGELHMASAYLNSLSSTERKDLEQRLFEIQNGKCFICELPVNLTLQAGQLDIDHVEPLRLGGKDTTANFALTHGSCNRSKQASDLRVARVLARFAKLRDDVAAENRGADLGDVLISAGGSEFEISIQIEGQRVLYSLGEIGDN